MLSNLHQLTVMSVLCDLGGSSKLDEEKMDGNTTLELINTNEFNESEDKAFQDGEIKPKCFLSG